MLFSSTSHEGIWDIPVFRLGSLSGQGEFTCRQCGVKRQSKEWKIRLNSVKLNLVPPGGGKWAGLTKRRRRKAMEQLLSLISCCGRGYENL